MNIIKKLLVFVIFFLNFLVNAQGPVFDWVKSIGGYRGSAIDIDSDNNIYTIGQFSGKIDCDPGPGVYTISSTMTGPTTFAPDLFISKFDNSGNFLTAIDITNGNLAAGTSISVDDQGNIFAAGYFSGSVDFDPGPGTFILNYGSLFNMSAFVLKLDPSGNFLWAKSFGNYPSGASECWSMTIDKLKNVYFTGQFSQTVDFDPGPNTYNLTTSVYACYIAKLDSLGNFVWAKVIGGTGDTFASGIAIDDSGNIYTTGGFSGTIDFDPGPQVYNITNFGFNDIFVSKLNASGDFVYAKKLGGNNHDVGRSIILDKSGNVYTTGFFMSTSDFDPGPGVFNLTSKPSSTSIFISKLNFLGDFEWAKSIGEASQSEGYSIAVDVNKNVYSTGYFGGTSDFDPGEGIYDLTLAGVYDIFISKLDSMGNFSWAGSIGSANNDYGQFIKTDELGNIFITGKVDSPSDLDPGVGVFNCTIPGEFLLKLPPGLTAQSIYPDLSGVLKIYPNPNSGKFTLQLGMEINIGKLILINAIGQKVYEQKIIKGTNEINTNGLSFGLYNYVLFQDDQKIISGKLVIE